MSLTSLVITAAESADEGINPFVIGGSALAALLFGLVIVLSIGGGRDHS